MDCDVCCESRVKPYTPQEKLKLSVKCQELESLESHFDACVEAVQVPTEEYMAWQASEMYRHEICTLFQFN